MRNASPLRYPGGKWRLNQLFHRLIALNFEQAPSYVEPYAGGASLALSLLFTGSVSAVYLNDLDVAVYAFWDSILHNTAKFARLIETIPLTTTEWRRQKTIYAEGVSAGNLRLGFATFYLNRTNHSGILNGGMIGGKDQRGTWKLDARFNRSELVTRIRRVAEHKDRIHLSNVDAFQFVKSHHRCKRKLLYLDPPYYRPGRHLYLNAYKADDHARLRDIVLGFETPWVISYDDVRQTRGLYRTVPRRRISLLHTAREARQGSEIVFFSPKLRIPPMN